MNLFILKEVANLFKTYNKVSYIARIADNIIRIDLDNQAFYIDLNKAKSNIFCIKNPSFEFKTYKAPFDVALVKYCLKAYILDCKIDGNNRILILSLRKHLQYKVLDIALILEFTGKYTNAILVDSCEIIVESLRKITQNTRVIKNGIKFTPLPQQSLSKTKKIILEMEILDFLYQNYTLKAQENLENIKSRAIESLKNKKEKLQVLLNQLPLQNELLSKAKEYALIGELLQINPNAIIKNNTLILKDYEGIERIFEIREEMDFNKSLINEFFSKSKKIKAKAENIILQQENLSSHIAFLESKIDFIQNAKNLLDIKIITQKNHHQKKQKIKSKYESFFIDNIKISLGKNRAENILLLKDAKADDIWMHIRNIPSSHLIIHTSKNTPKNEVIQKTGEILVGLLKVKNGNFLVDYTKRKFVKIKEGANVVYSHHSTLQVKK